VPATLTAVLTAVAAALAGAVTAAAVLGARLARAHRELRTARRLLNQDPLTGLPNRRAALAHLDAARQVRRPIAVALLDLDRFKDVNERFGHAGGDAALRQVSARLAALPAPVRLAARLHGDEFLLVIDGDAAEAEAAARTAWRTLAATPLEVAGQPLALTASIGVTTAVGATTAADDVLAAADHAMYQAKTRGTGVHLHTPGRHRPAPAPRPRRQHRDRPRAGNPSASSEQRTPAVATDLYFPLEPTLRLAEHAVAAATHEQSFTEHEGGVACPGALVWVADDGTYLMSGGSPPLLADPDDPTSNVVVHAHGYGPGSDRDLLGATDVGFDDFAEHLHLTVGDPPLIDMLHAAMPRGYRWLVLRVHRDTVTTRLSRTDPPQATGS